MKNMQNSNLKKFKDNLQNFTLENKITIAYSGGTDSSFMLDLFVKAGFEVKLAYLNHMIRDDFEKEEEFVKGKAEKLGLELILKRVDIKKIASERKIGLEEAGRCERYTFFESLNEIVATAHNLDDNVETFIFRLLRGSSINGLKGIPDKRDNFIRPILNFSRYQIEKYLKENKIEYFKDYSNFDKKFTRNRIRHELFPIFESINPQFRDKIVNFMNDLKGIKIDSSFLQENNIDRNKLKNIENILQKDGSCTLDLSKDRVIKKIYDKIIIEDRDKEVLEEKTLKINSSVKFGKYVIKAEIVDEIEESNNTFYCQFVDNFTVRVREPGDFIYQKGMEGRKKLKNLFIDKKIDRFTRDKLPIVCYKNEVIWIAGIVGSEKFRYKSGKIVKLSLI